MRGPSLLIIVVVLAIAGAVVVGLLAMGQSALRSPTEHAQAPGSPCRDAVQQVRAYRAPSATRTVEEAVVARLVAEATPARLVGWAPPAEYRSSAGPVCLTTLRFSIGDAPQEATWQLDPQSGRVEAFGAVASRLSALSSEGDPCVISC
jgi:hypothetical protein